VDLTEILYYKIAIRVLKPRRKILLWKNLQHAITEEKVTRCRSFQ